MSIRYWKLTEDFGGISFWNWCGHDGSGEHSDNGEKEGGLHLDKV